MAQDIRSEEVRFGLVLYGGVSLAIYMNGICQEFFRATRGSGVYGLAKLLADCDVVVDVISGTSAGGINGIFLAYALANGKNFADFADLWRQHGDIHRLLRDPSKDAEDCRSLLDSEGYYQARLEEAFRGMSTYQMGNLEFPSAVKELGLFVTGTDLHGNIYTRFDSEGHAIDIKDHRSVFLLKHRAGRKHPFDPNWNSESDPDCRAVTYRVLAKLCRLTSSFPFAFAPTHVANVARGEASPDSRLQTWGKLGKGAWFVDGGVLDNKPFTHTLKEIFHRKAERDVDRLVFYVEPDPEVFIPEPNPSEPNRARSVLDPVLGIPGYQSIADDLRMIASHNSDVQDFNRLRRAVEAGGLDRLEWNAPGANIYRSARLTQMMNSAIRGVLKVDGKEQLLRGDQASQASALMQAFDTMVGEMAGFEQDGDTSALILRDFDIYYRQRRAFYIADQLKSRISVLPRSEGSQQEKEPTKAQKAVYADLLHRFNRLVDLYDILGVAMESVIAEAAIPWTGDANDVWQHVQSALMKLLDWGGDPAVGPKNKPGWSPAGYQLDSFFPERELTDCWNGPLGERKAEIVAQFNGPQKVNMPATFESLLTVLDGVETQLVNGLGGDDPVRDLYEHFFHIDLRMFPLEFVSDIHEKNAIKLVRVSPKDAQRGFCCKDPAAKVAGKAAAHFGAFLKRSWRSNDILWGRLDGVCQICECLLGWTRVERRLKAPAFRDNARANLGTHAEIRKKLSGWFPSSPAASIDQLAKWVDELLTPPPSGPLDRDAYDSGLELLIEMAQLEILREELPKVNEDATAEQYAWNQFEISDGTGVPTGQFEPVAGTVDPHVAANSSWELSRAAMERLAKPDDALRPASTKVGTYFTDTYRVGQEEIGRDIPAMIRLRLVTTALLVTRNWLLGAIPGGEKLKKQPLYRLLLDYPLRFAHALTGYLSRVPRAQRIVLPGMLGICIAALVIGVKWFNPIVQQDGKLHLMAFGIFLLFPTVILLTAAVLLIGKWLPRAGVLKYLAAVAGVVALLGSVLWFLQTATGIHAALALLVAFLGGGLVAWLTRQRGPSDRELLACMQGMLESELEELAGRFKVAPALAKTELTKAGRATVAKQILQAAKKDKLQKGLLQELRLRNPLGLP